MHPREKILNIASLYHARGEAIPDEFVAEAKSHGFVEGLNLHGYSELNEFGKKKVISEDEIQKWVEASDGWGDDTPLDFAVFVIWELVNGAGKPEETRQEIINFVKES